MSVKESLKPVESKRVMDLVAEAGVDVTPWSSSSRGPVRVPASNPAYCYEWAFEVPGRLIVLNVWHQEIHEDEVAVWCKLNLRDWMEKGGRAESLTPGERSALTKRAHRMNSAMAKAFERKLPVRVIVGEGAQRNILDPESKLASRMKLRLLDPEPWSVQSYDDASGAYLLVRGASTHFVDQYTILNPVPPGRMEATVRVWERDRKIRDAALKRAKGQCELQSCRQPGFVMINGGIYLETHHVIPLSENGPDRECNVAALCPNHHREAHHGERRDDIRKQLLDRLERIYGSLPSPHSS